MLPYFIYMVLCLYFFLIIVPDGAENNNTASKVIGSLIIIMTSYQLIIEIWQLIIIRLDYFKDGWNVLMFGLLILNLGVVIAHLSITN